MTNFDRLKPHFEALFGEGWRIEDYAMMYESAFDGVGTCQDCFVYKDCRSPQYKTLTCYETLVRYLKEEVKKC